MIKPLLSKIVVNITLLVLLGFSIVAIANTENKKDPLPSTLDAFELLEHEKAEQEKVEQEKVEQENQANHKPAAIYLPPQNPMDKYLPLALAGFAVFIAFIALLVVISVVRKVGKPAKVFNQVNDHWYRTVIHPRCYLALLTLLQEFETQVLKAKNTGINQEQGVKLFWQLQEQKAAIANTMKMVITEPLVATAMVEQVDAIFAQMESECLAEMSEPNGELDAKQVKVESIGVAMHKVSLRFIDLHQQMVEMD